MAPDVDIVGLDEAPIRAFAYVSVPTVPFSDRDLSDLLRSARQFNARHGVTGKLLVLEAGIEIVRFAQWIEGPADSLDACIARIKADPRHGDFDVVHQGAVAGRRFPGWDMAVAPIGRAMFPVAASVLLNGG